jgi:hypothetical protein
MPYQPFYELFPEVADKETRVLSTFDHPHLPADDYALMEAYCNEPDCDCRRVFFNIGSRRTQEIVAVIAYGWESKRFYAKWFGRNEPGIIRELQGPVLNSTSPQSKLAPALLQAVTSILQDKRYVERLKRHYWMFKEVVDNESPEDEEIEFAPRLRIGRNDPCPCGSGKKYKQCCGR